MRVLAVGRRERAADVLALPGLCGDARREPGDGSAAPPDPDSSVKRFYIRVSVDSQDELERLRNAAGRPWFPAGALGIRYWVPSRRAAERELAMLILAGCHAHIEGRKLKA